MTVAIICTKQAIFSIDQAVFFPPEAIISAGEAIISVTKMIFSSIVAIILPNEAIVFIKETIMSVTERTMAEARVRLGFRNASDQQIAAIAAGVLEGMRGNPAFPDPPVDMMTLQTVMNEFNDAIAARAQRGRIGTAHKNKIRDKLMRRLRQVAHYVEMKCDNNRAVLLSSERGHDS